MIRIEVKELGAFNRHKLNAVWRELLNSTPPRGISRTMMRSIIAFELQARRQGNLSAAFLRKLEGIRTGIGSGSISSPSLQPGARLIREWNGVSHVVDITNDGVTWKGENYRSLSAVARAITGAHWSGPRFFGLSKANR